MRLILFFITLSIPFFTAGANAAILTCEGNELQALVSITRDVAESCSSSLIIEVGGEKACVADDEYTKYTLQPGLYQACLVIQPNGIRITSALSAFAL